MKKSFYFLFLIFFLLFIFSLDIQGSTLDSENLDIPYPSYIYDFWEEPVSAPQAYYPDQIITGKDLGAGSLSEPRDLHISSYNQNIYIVDSGNNRIIELNPDWTVKRIIDSFTNRGEEDFFNNPRGIYTNPAGDLYITDRDNGRIVILDQELNLKNIIHSPEGQVGDVDFTDFRFRPSKIAVDRRNRIFVVADEVYEGIMEFDIRGEFVGFFGAPSVTVDLFEYIWRRYSPQERRERLALFLPTEFSNLDVDREGFVFTTVATGTIGEEHFIRKLNTAGRDILLREGFTPPRGDYGSTLMDAAGEYVIPGSVFVDITVRENEMYSVLDRRRGRVFTYDRRGNLLYVFGYDGHLKGGFRYPRAVEAQGEKLAVLDGQTNRITVFKPTEYARKIHQALDYYHSGSYQRSVDIWREVLRLNANYDLAYTGIGRGELFQDNFEAAMNNFRRGENRLDYSRAFVHYRKEVIEENITLIGLLLLIIAVLLFLIIKFRAPVLGYLEKINQKLENRFGNRNNNESEKITVVSLIYDALKKTVDLFFYGFQVIFHPVGGFWNLKHEKPKSIAAATFHLIIVIITFIFMRQYTGFIFNPRDLTELNTLVEIASVLIPFFLWCVVSWSLTTLMEGKGTFTEIYITTAYSLIPVAFINIPLTVISNYLTGEEHMFYLFILVMSAVWAFILLFFGTLTIHEYTATKMLLVTGAIILGITLTMFIGLLFFNLVEQVFGFFSDIYMEIVYRI